MALNLALSSSARLFSNFYPTSASSSTTGATLLAASYGHRHHADAVSGHSTCGSRSRQADGRGDVELYAETTPRSWRLSVNESVIFRSMPVSAPACAVAQAAGSGTELAAEPPTRRTPLPHGEGWPFVQTRSSASIKNTIERLTGAESRTSHCRGSGDGIAQIYGLSARSHRNCSSSPAASWAWPSTSKRRPSRGDPRRRHSYQGRGHGQERPAASWRCRRASPARPRCRSAGSPLDERAR